jgi:hypothetical protein
MTLLSKVLLTIIFPVSLFAQQGAKSVDGTKSANVATETKDTATETKNRENEVDLRNEVFIGYGYASSFDILFPALKLYGTDSELAGYTERNMKVTGAFSAGWKYRLQKVASIGLTYSLGIIRGEVWWGTAQVNEYWGRVNGLHHSLAVECDFRYVTLPIIEVYTTVGLGVSISQHNFTARNPYEVNPPRKSVFYLPDFHVSLVGAKFGNERAGGFAELGFGYKGIINLGAYVRF